MAAVEFHSHPEQFVGRGTVFLAYYPDNDPPLQGYWDLLPDGPPTALAPLPMGRSVWEAIKWGRDRAPRLVLRFDHPWAGGVIWRIGQLESDEPEVEFFDPRIERDDEGRVVRVGGLRFDEQS